MRSRSRTRFVRLPKCWAGRPGRGGEEPPEPPGREEQAQHHRVRLEIDLDVRDAGRVPGGGDVSPEHGEARPEPVPEVEAAPERARGHAHECPAAADLDAVES